MSDDEVHRIAQAVVTLQMQQCRDCSEEGKERHARQHAFLDRVERWMDRMETTKWKVFAAVLVAGSSILTVALVTWLVLRVVHVDLREWR